MNRPALLIIDMQNDFVLEGAPLRVTQGEIVIPKILEILCEFRKRKLPVFHILRIHRADGTDVEIHRRELFRRHPFAVEGSSGAAVVDALTPLPGEYVVPKTRMSAFIGTGLDLMLRSLGVTELVITGIQTPNCIRTTVFDAVAYNYPVVFVEDAIGAQNEGIHACNTRDIANIGVRIVKTQDIAGLLD
ncbi:MAG TPA: isochorismatase family cysteine hydrolase [Methanoregula sp.]|nr:isochorismatase family cysteine hydrolase [Methanoregula sp.]